MLWITCLQSVTGATEQLHLPLHRLTGGTLGFMALSSLIVLLYLYRWAPCLLCFVLSLHHAHCWLPVQPLQAFIISATP